MDRVRKRTTITEAVEDSRFSRQRVLTGNIKENSTFLNIMSHQYALFESSKKGWRNSQSNFAFRIFYQCARLAKYSVLLRVTSTCRHLYFSSGPAILFHSLIATMQNRNAQYYQHNLRAIAEQQLFALQGCMSPHMLNANRGGSSPCP